MSSSWTVLITIFHILIYNQKKEKLKSKKLNK